MPKIANIEVLDIISNNYKSDMSKPEILVTGGLGYTGSETVRKLVKEGFGVTVFDNEMYGTNPRARLNSMLSKGLSPAEALATGLKDVNLDPKDYRYRSGDTRDGDSVRSLICEDGFDLVIHLAEVVGIPAFRADPETAKSINYDGTINVIQAVAATNGKTRLVWPSSSSVYFRNDEECIEGTFLPDPETLYPYDPYASTKLLVEQYISGLVEQGADLDCIVLRPATAGGLSGRMRLDLLTSTIVYDLLTSGGFVIGNGEDRRAFVDIGDLTDLYVSLAQGSHWQRGTYNIGHLNGSKRDFVHQICGLLGLNPDKVVRVDDSVGDGRDLTISSKLAQARLMYSPKRGLQETVLPMVQLLRDHPRVFSRINPDAIDPEFTNVPQFAHVS